jgi:poly-gamma-glutamate capsule biosynthesis protein CapA/YwtB (metallophosphatase superfamily)
MGLRLSPPILVVVAAVALSCGGSAPEPPEPPPPAEEAPTPESADRLSTPVLAPPLATEERPLSVAVDLQDAAERARVTDALRAAGLALVAEGPADARVNDHGVDGGSAYPLEAWAVVTDQRHDVLELSTTHLIKALTGELTDWSEIGGGEQAITILLPGTRIDEVARMVGMVRGALVGELKSIDAMLQRLQSDAGTLALLPVAELRPGILALILDGHDPYRDPHSESPLRIERWISAADTALADRIADALDWTAVSTDPLGLLATGDFLPVRCSNAALEARGHAAAFESVGDALRAADLTVVSVEVALTDRVPPTPCERHLSGPFVLQGSAAAIPALVGAGVDVVTAAGNHVLDCWGGCPGGQVLADTLAGYAAAGLAHAGIGITLSEARAPAIVEADGIRVAVLSYDDIAPLYWASDEEPGAAPLTLPTLDDDVRAASELADFVVVAFSWGIEYSDVITTRQQDAARIAIAAGASVVVGNHPHTIQPVEVVEGGVVAYALGNFLFDQDWSIATTQSLILEVGLATDRLLGFRIRPVVVRDVHRPEFVDPAGEGASILQRFWRATDALLLDNRVIAGRCDGC